MDVVLVTVVVLVGFASGILSGMVGIGGAVVTTPGIRFLGATPIEAVGSTLPAILPGAISGSFRYAKAQMIEWRVGVTSGVFGAGFAVLGAWFSDLVNAHVLMLLTAGLLAWSAVRARRPSAPPSAADDHVADVEAATADVDSSSVKIAVDARPAPPTTKHPLPVLCAIGAASGLLAGILGVGGGLILVPGFTLFLGLPPKRAVATSLVAVAIFSVPAMVTHAVLGHVNWAYALPLVVGVVPGAQVGAHLTIGASEERLRKVIATFFGLLSVVYAVRELAALL